VFPLLLGGTSTGTNTFTAQFGSALWGGNLVVSGPGTWAFSNVFNFTNSLIISNGAHCALLYNSDYPLSEIPGFAQVNLKSGSTFDVSAFDQNSSIFTLGEASGYPQILTAGRTNTAAAATDINGSLSLDGAAAATLNVAGTGVPGTLTISSNLVAGSGTIQLDLGTNTTTGLGSNDLIIVGGNLDLSQGSALITINPLKGALNTNAPYTLITYGGSLLGSADNLSVPSPSRSYNPGVVTAASGQVQVTFNASGTTNANLVWQGNDGANWDVQTTPNWLNDGSSDYFFQGDNVTFNDSASQFSVNVVGTPAPATMTFSNSANPYTLSGGTVGGGSLTKRGSAELTLASANTYSGGTVISAGTISAGNNTALGTAAVTLGDGNTGTNEVGLLVNGGATIANAITVSSNGSGTAIVGYESGGNCTINGAITLQRGVTLYTTNATTAYSLLVQGGISGTGDVTVTGGGSVKLQTGSCAFSGNLYVIPGNNPSPATNTTYVGVNASLSTNCNVTVASGAIFGNVSSPNINALNGGGWIEPGYGATYNAAMPVGYGNGSGTFSGSFTTNSGGWSCVIVKYGTGTEVLTGDNSASGSGANGGGGTTVNAGTLAVNNTSGYGLGIGGVTVNSGGTLAGTGTVFAVANNTFVVNGGGVLSVGNAGDTSGNAFTFTSTNAYGLTIGSGGALNVDLFSGAGAGDNTAKPAAADVFNAQCVVTLNSGAILNVANPNNLSAWAVGDKWKIVNWSSTPTGTFTVTNLPALPSALAWDTSALYTNGVIGIVANTSSPTLRAQILGISLSDANLVINGTNLNGGQNFHYAVLTSTNVLAPLSDWTVLSTNSFNADGTFVFTNAINPSRPAAYFEVKAVP
jgi:autotransporter-associated beta strand protein